MMGGLAIYAHDVTFAMYDPDQGYFLKSDDLTQEVFEAANVERFEFKTKDGKVLRLNYYAMPEPCYDDPDLCLEWAHRSLDVALRAKSKKRKKKK